MQKVVINGLKQNCFVKDCRTVTCAPHIIPIMKYPELKKKELDNGFIEQVEILDYPITSESVTSYVDSADYKRDPMSAIANASKRVNLGDITQVQDFVTNNPHDAVRVYKAVGEQLAKYYDTLNKAEPKTEPVEPKPVEPKQGGSVQ